MKKRRKKRKLNIPNNWSERENNRLGLKHDELSHLLQHNSRTGSFNDLTKSYKAARSIEHYLKLRRNHPETLIEVATNWGLDWLFANEKHLVSLSIDPDLVAGALDADYACISELSLRLLEHIVERSSKAENGETHIQSRGDAIGDSLVNYLIAMMLDALDWNNDLHISRDLIVLIKHQLGADTSAEDAAMKSHERRTQAIWLAAQLRHNGLAGSMRQVANVMKVNPSSVSRWFPEENFDEEVERIRLLFERGIFDEVRKTAENLKRPKS